MKPDMEYDPNVAPDRERWLALDQDERAKLAENSLRRSGVEASKAQAYAWLCVLIETQIARGAGHVCRAMDRLCGGGLSRLEAMEAIYVVIDQHASGVLKTELNKAIEVLSVTQARSYVALFNDALAGNHQ